MPVFLISYSHPDHDGWVRHQAAHLDWLHEQHEQGRLLASGAPDHGPVKAGFLIAKAEDDQAVRDWVKSDPYAAHGLVAQLTITRWDPVFGAFQSESSCAGLEYPAMRTEILEKSDPSKAASGT